jgi:ABC-2 type transport system permease protein
MTLLRAELARAGRREVVRFVAVAGLVGVLVGCAIAGLKSQRPTDSQWDEAKVLREAARRDCLDQPDLTESAEAEALCDPGPLATWLSPEIRVFDIASIPDTIVWSSLLLGLAGWLIGATLIGADWASGSLATVLTWEPRRVRLLLAKYAASALTTLGVSCLLLAALVIGLSIVAATRGLTSTHPSFWADVGATSLRVVVISGVAALAAAGLASIARSATFAVASLFVYLVAVEGPIHLRLPDAADWLVTQNAVAWTTGKLLDTNGGSGVSVISSFHVAALGVVALWVGTILAVGCWIFHRRDVS